MTKHIKGLLPILHTPLHKSGELHTDDLAREIDWVYQNNCDGLCTAMVSEILRMSIKERIELNTKVSELNQNRGVFISSVGAESTAQASELTQYNIISMSIKNLISSS